MKRSLLLLALLCAGSALAQSTYRWVDQDGKVHFGDRPPPAQTTREVKERKISLPSFDKQLPHETRKAMEAFPVTLFVTPDCVAPCNVGREYLSKRDIPFSEKSIVSNNEKASLREKLGGGDFGVPVLQVGNKYSRGFLEAAWAGLLDAAGYPKAANP